jgi:hypothetical protein
MIAIAATSRASAARAVEIARLDWHYAVLLRKDPQLAGSANGEISLCHQAACLPAGAVLMMPGTAGSVNSAHAVVQDR